MRQKPDNSQCRNAILVCVFALGAYLFLSRIKPPVAHAPPASITLSIPTQVGATVTRQFTVPNDTDMGVTLDWEGVNSSTDTRSAEASHLEVTWQDMTEGNVKRLVLDSGGYDLHQAMTTVGVSAGHHYEVTCRILKTDRDFASSRPTLTVGVSQWGLEGYAGRGITAGLWGLAYWCLVTFFIALVVAGTVGGLVSGRGGKQ